MSTPRRLALFACAIAGLTGPRLRAQEPTPAPAAPTAPAPLPTPASLIERFDRLDRDQRQLVVRNMEKRLVREEGEILQRIQGMQRGEAAYPPRPASTWFEPRDYAPGAAPRQVVAQGTDEHRKATRRMTPFVFLSDLHAEFAYDWGLGKAVRASAPLSDEQRFANYVHGYPPGTDQAVARVLEALDQDPQQRVCGNYFEHLYADRGGQVFAGTSLFDAWNSGLQIEMPDTDAIAFARLCLQTASFTAPLPTDRRRERLYQKMREGFATYREYRTLRLAAAAAFIGADPPIDPTYAPLVRRCHYLWPKCEYVPKRLAERFAKATDRAALLDEVDTAIRAETDIIETTRQLFLETSTFLVQLADYELSQQKG